MKSFYINGTVITMEDDALYAEAVCAENGKILAVGDQDEIMKLYEEPVSYTHLDVYKRQPV